MGGGRIMKFREQVRQAVANEDAGTCGRIAEHLRLKGFTYDDVFRFVHRLTEVSPVMWDGLMYDYDEADK